MVKKKQKKTELEFWSCGMSCGSNCCSEIYFRLNKIQKLMFDRSKSFVERTINFDLKLLSYQEGIKVKELGTEGILITITSKNYEFKKYPYTKEYDYLHLKEKCSKLNKDNSCSIYNSRPKPCAVLKCPVFTDDESLCWFAKNGLLKQQHEMYKSGELRNNV